MLQLCVHIMYLRATLLSQRQRFIPMHSVARNLGKTLSAALPVIHVLSGCDSTSAFSGIRKKRWLLKVASQHLEIIDRLCYIGQDSTTINRDAKEAWCGASFTVVQWEVGKCFRHH